ncbi:doxx family protein [Zobellia sp. B3R18]|uniref:doxx family protein n=1 Tax=Zobellia sp. B3R18 TaxID=2841568 RepID=UPI001C06C3BC|nr:doxx family protein [Zobellia sp. B3R18]MBU2974405.1 doxx family protein [Zobellia sp. B3R18]
MPSSKTALLYTHFKKISLLQISIGVVYLWFGSLKFFSDASPAEEMAKDTISVLTMGLIPRETSIILLAILEAGIGIFLLLDIYRKQTVIITLAHMVCTFTSLLLLSEISFTSSPFAPTLLGQYVIKNLIIIAALISIYQNTKKA